LYLCIFLGFYSVFTRFFFAKLTKLTKNKKQKTKNKKQKTKNKKTKNT